MDIGSLIGGLVGAGIGGGAVFFLQNNNLKNVQDKLERAKNAQQESETLQEQRGTELQNLEQKYQRQIQTLEQQIQQLQRVQSQAPSTEQPSSGEGGEMESSYKARLQEERERHQAELQGLERSYEDQIRELNRSYQAQMLEMSQADYIAQESTQGSPFEQNSILDTERETYIPGMKAGFVEPVSQPVIEPSFDLRAVSYQTNTLDDVDSALEQTEQELIVGEESWVTDGLEVIEVANQEIAETFETEQDLIGLDEFIAEEQAWVTEELEVEEEITSEQVAEASEEDLIGLDDFIQSETWIQDDLSVEPAAEEFTGIQSERESEFDFNNLTTPLTEESSGFLTQEGLVEEEQAVLDDFDLLESFTFEQSDLSSLDDDLALQNELLGDSDSLDFLEISSPDSLETTSEESDFFEILSADDSSLSVLTEEMADEESLEGLTDFFESSGSEADLEFVEMLEKSQQIVSTSPTDSQPEVLVDPFADFFSNDTDLEKELDLADLLDDSSAGDHSLDELSDAFPDLFGDFESESKPDNK